MKLITEVRLINTNTNSEVKCFSEYFYLFFFLVKDFNVTALRTRLLENLHSDISLVANLTCANNQGQVVPCANGYCQLARQGLSLVDRTCVPQGKGANPSGIMISSNTMEGPNAEARFVYACNKPMCNGAETDLKMRQALVQSGLLQSSYLSPSEVTSPTTTGITIMTSRTTNSNTTGGTPIVTSSGTNAPVQSINTTTTNTPTTTGITIMISRTTNSNTTGGIPIVTSSGTNAPVQSINTTTTNTPTTTTNAATTTFRKTIMNYQWMLFLIMTVFL
jgi:hypothetical protein